MASQPQVLDLLCPLESWEVNLKPHDVHWEIAQLDLAAIIFVQFFFLLWAPLCRTEVGRIRLAWFKIGGSRDQIDDMVVAQRFPRPKGCGAENCGTPLRVGSSSP